MKRVTILGATGSIGQNTIDLITRALEQNPEAYDVVALTGGANVELLARDARRLNAQIAVTCYEDRLDELRQALSGSTVKAAAGSAALIEAAARPADWIMSAIIGSAGLAPGLEALKHGTTLALANKESLVTAGPLLLKYAKQYGSTILPVDSEHSAVFQALQGEDMSSVEQVVITASGGAFRDWSLEEMATATPEQAASHPNWSMGQRITIDSASMFNKAMELIEAKEFFGLKPEKIHTVIHPESLVHALVGFCDGAMMAHVSAPDMRHAIGYALHYPNRAPLPVNRLDLAQIGQLNFRAIDEEKYPAVRLARRVMDCGGHVGAVFNAAKERALDAFLAKKIGFLQMSAVVEEVMEHMIAQEDARCLVTNYQSLFDIDHLTRCRVDESIMKLR